MSDAHPNTHFMSGEPGTTGREPFDESLTTGSTGNHPTSAPGKPNFTGAQHQQEARDAGLDIPVIGGASHGTGHHEHGHQHQHGENRVVDSLTAGSGTHAHATSGHHSGTADGRDLVGGTQSHGLTGSHENRNPMTSNYGVGHGQHGVGAGAGSAGLAGAGVGAGAASHSHGENRNPLTTDYGVGNQGVEAGHEKSHFSNDKPTRHTNENEQDKKGLAEKAKEAVGMGGNKEHDRSDVGHREHGSGLTGGLAGERVQGGREHGDRVGALGQNADAYEGSLGSGPRTSGAAGTDRFDSSRSHASERLDNRIDHDTSQRAPGQSSGGIGGVLGTSDKDFTGRERQGKGAYADTDGDYDLNKSGPAGNTALTGREGNLDNNPVADRTGEEHHEKKGLMQKVKEAISK